jgi:hypothetical protein
MLTAFATAASAMTKMTMTTKPATCTSTTMPTMHK